MKAGLPKAGEVVRLGRVLLFILALSCLQPVFGAVGMLVGPTRRYGRGIPKNSTSDASLDVIHDNIAGELA
jgi:hypothetical protein